MSAEQDVSSFSPAVSRPALDSVGWHLTIHTMNGGSSDHPSWNQDFPDHINLTQYQVERLELIRRHVGVPEHSFRLHVIGHPECSKMLQRSLFEQIRRKNPGMPDELALVTVIYTRYLTARATGHDLFGLQRFPLVDPDQPPAELIEAIAEMIRARGWGSIDDVAQAIHDEEARLPTIPPVPGLEGAARQVTVILAERTDGASK